MNGIRPDVLRMFYSAPRGRSLAGYPGVFFQVRRWGGWGSNPRPADYEKYGPVHRAR